MKQILQYLFNHQTLTKAEAKDRIKHPQRELEFEFETDDETDALAVAISFYEKYLKL